MSGRRRVVAGNVGRAGPDRAELVTVAQARDWAGLFSDRSMDHLVAEGLKSAHDIVAKTVGYGLGPLAVTEHFAAAGSGNVLVLAMTRNAIRDGTLAVSAWRDGDADAAGPVAGWRLDPTSRAGLVMMPLVPDISQDYELPIVATYDAWEGVEHEGVLQQGVRTAFMHYWTTRGEPASHAMLDRALASLLQSARKRTLED